LHGDVVVGDDRDHAHPRLSGRQLGGHLEVHHVAGVVLDDVQDARAAVDQLGRRQHLVGNGRGEDLPRAGRVEHPQSDESAVERLVAGATARDDADLPAAAGTTPVNDLVLVIDLQVGVGRVDSQQRLGHDVVRVVDQLFHEIPFYVQWCLRPLVYTSGDVQ
jgi:hypothetical protein